MYKAWYGEHILHDPGSDIFLTDASLTVELNASGEFEFVVPATHPSINDIVLKNVDDEIRVFQDDVCIFEGRAVEQPTSDFLGNKRFVCEGELAYFADSIVRPYSTVAGKAPRKAPSTVDGYFQYLVDQHNEQVEEKKRFTVGMNQGALLDKNNYVYRADGTYPTTATTLRDKITASALGGFIRARHNDGVRYIDLLANSDAVATQRIEFGENLLDFARDIDGSQIITAVIPLGKTLETSEDEEVVTLRLDISSTPDGDVDNYGRYQKQGDRIWSVDAASRRGWITESVYFDDISDPSNLRTAGYEYLQTKESAIDSIVIKAVDLSQINDSLEPFYLGDYIRATSGPHGYDSYMLCSRIVYSITDPDQTEFTLGLDGESINLVVQRRIDELNSGINNTYEKAALSTDTATQAAKDAAQAASDASDASKIASEAAEEVATKSSNFLSQPSPPYRINDTWTQGLTGDMYTCTTTRTTGNFNESDWVLSTKYTDDSLAEIANENASEAKEAAETAEDAANIALDEVRETSSYFFHDANGAHVASAEGDGNAGSNVLITAASILLRKATTVLISIAENVISFLGGQGYIGLSTKSPLGEIANGFDMYAESGRKLNLYSGGGDGVRVLNNTDLKKHSAIIMNDQHIQIGVGNGAVDEFGAGGYMVLTNGRFNVDAPTTQIKNRYPMLAQGGAFNVLTAAGMYSVGVTDPGTFTIANTATGSPVPGSYGNFLLAASGGNRVVGQAAFDNGEILALSGYVNSMQWRHIGHVGRTLYSNASGSNGTITLSESAANFIKIDLLVRSNDGDYKIVSIYSPNGKRIALDMIRSSTGANAAYFKSAAVTISGTTITPLGGAYGQGAAGINNYSTFTAANYLYICMVIGYR